MKRNIKGEEIPRFPFPTEILVLVINFLELCDIFNFRLTCKHAKYAVLMAVKGWKEYEKEYRVMKNLYREPESQIFEIYISYYDPNKESMKLHFDYFGDLFHISWSESFEYDDIDRDKCKFVERTVLDGIMCYYDQDTFLLSNITQKKLLYPQHGFQIYMDFVTHTDETKIPDVNSTAIIREILFFIKSLRVYLDLDHIWKGVPKIRLRPPYRNNDEFYTDSVTADAEDDYQIFADKYDLSDLVTYSKYMRKFVKELRLKNKVVDLEDIE